MAKGAATEKLLAELHSLTASQMKKKIEDCINGDEEMTASYLSVIIKFLKDNNIEADPENAKELKSIAASLPDLEDIDEEHYNTH